MNKYYSQRLSLLFLSLLSYLLPRLAAEKALRIFLTPQKVPRPSSEKAWFESARKWRSKENLALFEWGNPAGPVVLLVHGWNGRGTQMAAFAAPLVDRNFRVIALDGPAHGDSEGQETNAGSFSRALVQLQKELGPLESLIGHSFGAGCLVLAVHWGLQTKKLVLIAGPARYGVVIENFLKFIGLGKRAQKEFIAQLTVKAGIAPEDLDISKLASSLQIPGLIVHDQEDKEVLFLSATMIHEAWPGSKILATQGLGHRRVLKDPGVVQVVTDFILP